MARKKDHGTVAVRITADANRLAQACAGVAGMTKPEWISQVIRRSAAHDFPEVVARVEARQRPHRRPGG